MKGEIKMDTSNNENVTLDGAKMVYTVLCVEEDKDNGKVDISVSATFDNMSDAKKFKDAKDSFATEKSMWAGPTPEKIMISPRNLMLTSILINILSYTLTKEKAWKVNTSQC